MKTLEVVLDYGGVDGSLRNSPGDLGFSTPFPYRVMDAHGSMLAEGVVNSHESSRVQFEDPGQNDVLFVRLVWPSGKSTTREAHYGGHGGASVHFSDESIGDEQWSKWAATRVPSGSASSAEEASVARFDNVWLRLWTFSKEDSAWRLSSGMPMENPEASPTARQIDLRLEKGSHLLQVGGAQMPWLFVSLPGGGPCRILLTPNPITGPLALPLKVVVSSSRPEAETLVEFLCRDRLRAADSVGQFGPVATKLLQEKLEDPVSAIAGAYYLLRVGRWKSTPLWWFDNLYNWTDWSCDAALLRCAITMRMGLKSRNDTQQVLDLLSAGLKRGLPLFEEGHRILLEIQSLLRGLLFHPQGSSAGAELRPDKPGDYTSLLNRCEELTAARAWMGPLFSFFGSTPDAPSATRLRGAPPDVEPKHVSPASIAEEATLLSEHVVLSLEPSGSAPLPSKTRRRSRKRSSVTYLKDL